MAFAQAAFDDQSGDWNAAEGGLYRRYGYVRGNGTTRGELLTGFKNCFFVNFICVRGGRQTPFVDENGSPNTYAHPMRGQLTMVINATNDCYRWEATGN